MKTINDIKKFVKNISVKTNTEINETIRTKIFEAFEKSKQTKSVSVHSNIWRTIVKKRMTKFAAVAVIIIAVSVGIKIFSGCRNESNGCNSSGYKSWGNDSWIKSTNFRYVERWL